MKVSCSYCSLQRLKSSKKKSDELIDVSNCRHDGIGNFLRVTCPSCKNSIYVKKEKND